MVPFGSLTMNWWSWLMVMVGVPCVTGIWAHPNLREWLPVTCGDNALTLR
jgi:hypothetical protein